MRLKVRVQRLSDQFYVDFPTEVFSEILTNCNRPYECIVIETEEYTICIPYRSHMSHNNGFVFNGTRRSKNGRSGLDYSKMIILEDDRYIVESQALLDKDEYLQVRNHIGLIKQQAIEYLQQYIGYKQGESELDPREYDRRYGHCTLQYFEQIIIK